MAARDGRGECRIELMRLLEGCVAAAASDALRCACKLRQGSFCAAQSRGPVASSFCRCSAGATVDIHTWSCTPLRSTQLGPECAKSL